MKCFYSDLILAFKLCQTGLLITLGDHPQQMVQIVKAFFKWPFVKIAGAYAI